MFCKETHMGMLTADGGVKVLDPSGGVNWQMFSQMFEYEPVEEGNKVDASTGGIWGYNMQLIALL
jgi:hypothetical protein